MHAYAFFNGGSRPLFELNLPAASSACLVGKGVFTTVAIYDRKPFSWEKHWTRLEANSATVAIDLAAFPESRTRIALDEMIAANAVRDGRARITFFDESESGLWRYEPEHRSNLLIITGDFRPEGAGISLTVSPYGINSRSPLAGVKSCNYLDKILALDDAKRRNFHEAIQLNERGEVASACTANVFWLKSGKLFTPSLGTGCLAGTTREVVLENLVCEEVKAGIEDLRSADEVFLTSAGLGVVQVKAFDGRKLNRTPHPITNLLPPLR